MAHEGGDNGGDDDDKQMNAGAHIPGHWLYVQPQQEQHQQ